MAHKNLMVFMGAFILLFLSLSLASALSVTITNPSEFTSINNITSVTITNNDASNNISVVIPAINSISDGKGHTLTVASSHSNFIVPSLSSETINFTYNGNADSFVVGTFTTIVNFNIVNESNTSDNATQTKTLSFLGSLCKYGEVGEDLIEIQSIKDRKLDNENEWEWRPLDNVEIDVKVQNTGDSDEDYTIRLIFTDSSGSEVEVADDEDDLEQDVSIDEGKRKTITFSFQVSGDIEEGNYKLFAKVVKEGDEDEQCVTLQAEEEGNIEEVSIKRKKHDVLVKTVKGQTTAKCGDTITFEAKVSNIGKEDQDKVNVILFNREINIRLEKEINNLDEGDSETITFLVDLPKDAQEKIYTLSFVTEFDYDEDDETFGKTSENKDEFKHFLTLLGECGAKVEEAPTITATLASSAKVGEELIIQISVTNPGDATDIIVTVSGHESWASLESIEPSILHIEKANTKQILITLKPTKAGAQTFTIKAIYNGKTTEQAVSVNIEEETAGFLTGAFAGIGNTTLYVIAGVFLLLIILIIILIIKVASSGRKSAEF